jgi:phenylalanyl-tRNA synthetase alpha chain
MEAFSYAMRLVNEINKTITGVCTDIMRKTMSHLAELVASAKAAINEASDVAALDNVRVEYLEERASDPSDDHPA